MKVALVGSAPSSVRLAPAKDWRYARWAGGRPLLERHQYPFVREEWQIWGCSPGVFGVFEHFDRWFELHRWEPGQPWFSPEYVQFLTQFNGTVYTGGQVPEIRNGSLLPAEALVEQFSEYPFTSSLSIMCGMAILEIEADRALGDRPEGETDTIGFFGVDMAATEEWNEQRPGCQWMLVEAHKRGIHVVLPPESDLYRPQPMYGMREWSPAWIKGQARRNELLSNVNAAKNNIAAETARQHFFAGALENQDYNLKTWILSPGSPMVAADEHGKQLVYLPAPPTVPAAADQLPRSGWIGNANERMQHPEVPPWTGLPASNG
jgi:hypothetical protein